MVKDIGACSGCFTIDAGNFIGHRRDKLEDVYTGGDI